MPVGAADLHQAVMAVWNSATLDNRFTLYWPDTAKTEFVVLSDMEGEPKQPYPYCIFQQSEGNTVVRTSGGEDPTKGREIRDVPWEFSVQARATQDSAAKDIAAILIEEIMKVFGGHPTHAPASNFNLENGNTLLCQYQGDYGARTDLENYSWVIRYKFTLDVPVALQ